MHSLSSSAAWAAAVFALSGLRLELDSLTAWEAEVRPFTLEERLPPLAVTPRPPLAARIASLAPQPGPGLGCAAELVRWHAWWAQKNNGSESSLLEPNGAFAREAYLAVRRAQLWLDWHHLLITSIDLLQGAHRLLFEGCPWSGVWPTRAQPQPSRRRERADLPSEMDRMAMITREQFRRANRSWTQAEAVAFYHAELLRVRPFMEGNHLLALLVAGTQLHILFGHDRNGAVDPAGYADAMDLVRQRVTLVPLTRWFHERIAGRAPFPYARNPLAQPWRQPRRSPVR